MRKTLFLGVLSALVYQFSAAQSDTVYHYYADNKEVTKDSAYTYLKLYKKDNQWFGQEFISKNNHLVSEGNFRDNDVKSRTGSFKYYDEKGTLEYVGEWDNTELLSRTYYYENGKKKSWIKYNGKNDSEQKGWDENGKEIRNFIVEREARFKGGLQGWVKFLQKNLNANVAANAGVPPGNYTVEVRFVIDKEGNVSKVKATKIPEACKPCAAEAVSVISNGPQWEHATQHNRPVIYQAIQYITFQVAEDVKKGRKG